MSMALIYILLVMLSFLNYVYTILRQLIYYRVFPENVGGSTILLLL